ncbi:malonyl CoA-acyl carrier protein transacylase [Rubidibacter lacunae KORDI 51-2]|uniref:Malonyl CoA-acyl carrier protein transacylase n=1 Tax=Rubidibacter lacunae KORDI 51-2 TaxID=582515 RepID=U5D6I8_9CHRO|nr:ACP S-malonyltransferase [Rubidibacter lacunae]ERN40273.1 malonyl CoA-acyl carrier protein transacylase [Rubidibacter lacunae KORDI 51-2]
MTKTAWVFPGQGSQALGMDADLTELLTARNRFAIAEEILGWSIPELCHSSEETLARTLYTQPCLYAIACILADVLRDRGREPQLAAGHSLGEYVALYVGQVFDFATGLQLVKRRAELMDAATGGQMVALMKFDRAQLEAVVAQTPNAVLANDNSEQQAVISGTPDAVAAVLEQVKARRVIPLKVSGAFHSPLMGAAAAEFESALEPIPFADASVPVLSNVDPTPEKAGHVLKQRIIAQMTGPVRWREIVLRLGVEEITDVVEVGPGNVLTGLLKRTDPNIALHNARSAATCEAIA